MRTPASLLYPSPSTTRKPAVKRRRLNRTGSSSSITIDSLAGLVPPSKALADSASTLNGIHVTSSKLSCSTCHRALSSAMRSGAGAPLVCSRCSAPTCTICARTCTSYTRPPSFPPTPALTRSPTPSHIRTPGSISPKRTALGLSFSTMNSDMSAAPSVKRKQAPIDKDESEVDADGDVGLRFREQPSDAAGVEDISTEVVIPGCERVVCRACCVESVANDGKLCLDCYALV
ncbi:hypothetical protein HYDPIDRAFT_108047 [Hydnomerulius pinastri MD-312]|nr:hypothetical protein HYDPIDRAFT_108047 [Hydnomerulius pinastri MD-312]